MTTATPTSDTALLLGTWLERAAAFRRLSNSYLRTGDLERHAEYWSKYVTLALCRDELLIACGGEPGGAIE